MDPVTHGLIGASVTQSIAKQQKMRTAALLGAAGAMLPDLDVLISSDADPLLQLEFHRQFTHSLAFVPFAALIVAGIFWWYAKRKLTFKETYLYSLAGVSTAGIADMFTSYGVQLLWPFTDVRFSWDLISVFDPIFSLGILVGVVLAMVKKQRIFAFLAVSWLSLYLLFSLFQRQRALEAATELAEKRNHPVERMIVKPTIANQLVWSIRYISRDTLYAAGLRIAPFSAPLIYDGTSTALFNWRKQYSEYRGTVLYNDIQRFEDLSNGVLILHPNAGQVIGDGRYAMLPTSINPLWGIQADTSHPHRHVEFKTYREAGKKVRQKFKDMLFGVGTN